MRVMHTKQNLACSVRYLKIIDIFLIIYIYGSEKLNIGIQILLGQADL